MPNACDNRLIREPNGSFWVVLLYIYTYIHTYVYSVPAHTRVCTRTSKHYRSTEANCDPWCQTRLNSVLYNSVKLSRQRRIKWNRNKIRSQFSRAILPVEESQTWLQNSECLSLRGEHRTPRRGASPEKWKKQELIWAPRVTGRNHPQLNGLLCDLSQQSFDSGVWTTPSLHKQVASVTR